MKTDFDVVIVGRTAWQRYNIRGHIHWHLAPRVRRNIMPSTHNRLQGGVNRTYAGSRGDAELTPPRSVHMIAIHLFGILVVIVVLFLAEFLLYHRELVS